MDTPCSGPKMKMATALRARNTSMKLKTKDISRYFILLTENSTSDSTDSASSSLVSKVSMAAKCISVSCGCSVLLKGGHSINDANDLLYENGRLVWFDGKRIDNPNTHGTGCTLSSAIASNLAKGLSLVDSVKKAKKYISDALAAGLDLGNGSGPMKHNFILSDGI